MARLKEQYRSEAIPAMMREFGYKNEMQVPRLEKVVVNIGMGEALLNAKALDAAVGDLEVITGQHPVITRARRSTAMLGVTKASTPVPRFRPYAKRLST